MIDRGPELVAFQRASAYLRAQRRWTAAWCVATALLALAALIVAEWALALPAFVCAVLCAAQAVRLRAAQVRANAALAALGRAHRRRREERWAWTRLLLLLEEREVEPEQAVSMRKLWCRVDGAHPDLLPPNLTRNLKNGSLDLCWEDGATARVARDGAVTWEPA